LLETLLGCKRTLHIHTHTSLSHRPMISHTPDTPHTHISTSLHTHTSPLHSTHPHLHFTPHTHTHTHTHTPVCCAQINMCPKKRTRLFSMSQYMMRTSLLAQPLICPLQLPLLQITHTSLFH